MTCSHWQKKAMKIYIELKTMCIVTCYIYIYIYIYIIHCTQTLYIDIGRCQDETWKRQMSKRCFKNDFDWMTVITIDR